MRAIDIKKLDRRYDGWDLFTHRAEFKIERGGHERRADVVRWIECRNHHWRRWGPGIENSLFYVYRNEEFGSVDPNRPQWAWSDRAFVIYLRDQALTEFLLSKDRWLGPAVIA